MQREITKQQDLLNAEGVIAQPGWAKSPYWKYNHKNIATAKLRIKEWDYYCILSDTAGIALTLSDMGYLGFIGISVFDFTKGKEISNSRMAAFPMGKWNMPTSSASGVSKFSDKNITIQFSASGNRRVLNFSWDRFHKGRNLSGNIILTQQKDSDSIVVATPFKENKTAFYYNQKINCLSAQGGFSLGAEKTDFAPQGAFGVLDWGRGVWTYANTWYWGSTSGMVDGTPFGFNIGYGFGNLSTHSENALFYNGKLHKLDRVQFKIPEETYLDPWHFSDNKGRFTMEFIPVLDRSSKTNLVLLQSDQHQVFGRFSGRAVLDDGTILNIRNCMGFAEKVCNRW